MTVLRRAGAVLATAALLTAPITMVSSAEAAPRPFTFKNCTELNKRFPHGVGRPGARDRTTGVPVRNFHTSQAWYAKNARSDRDKDGIACEKR